MSEEQTVEERGAELIAAMRAVPNLPPIDDYSIMQFVRNPCCAG